MPQNITYGLISVIAFILILGVLVMVHELGHFLTARLFKVRVEEFGLGFPPRVYPSRTTVERRRAAGKTVYSLNLLPLGGFVRLVGENGVVDEAESGANDRDATTAGVSMSGRAAPAEDSGAFANKPAWQRAVVLAAGAFNNMVLAIVLVFGMFTLIGTQHARIEVIGVAVGSPAEAQGVLPGDRIGSVNGTKVEGTDDVRNLVAAHRGHPVALQLVRNGRPLSLTVIPRTANVPCDQGALGIISNPVDPYYAPLDAGQAAQLAVSVPGSVVQGFIGLVGGLINPPQATPLPDPQGSGSGVGNGPICTYPSHYTYFGGRIVSSAVFAPDNPHPLSLPNAIAQDTCLVGTSGGGGVAGPIGIIRQVGCEANAIPTQGWVPLLTLVVELSATLAVVNLLPFPALDGGRLLFVLISVVARRRIRPEVEGLAHALGMAALLTLMFFVSWHDVVNLINHRPAF